MPYYDVHKTKALLELDYKKVSLDEVRQLIQDGARINTNSFNRQPVVPPLHQAVRYGRTDLIRLFRENEADLEIPNYTGKTALFIAIIFFHGKDSKRQNIINALCQPFKIGNKEYKGANVNAQDNFKDPALHYAIRYKQVGTVYTLLYDWNAKQFLENRAHKTAMDVLYDSLFCTRQEKAALHCIDRYLKHTPAAIQRNQTHWRYSYYPSRTELCRS